MTARADLDRIPAIAAALTRAAGGYLRNTLKLTDMVDSPGLRSLGDLHERTAAAA